jgi:hypothetical protein
MNLGAENLAYIQKDLRIKQAFGGTGFQPVVTRVFSLAATLNKKFQVSSPPYGLSAEKFSWVMAPPCF